jgi:FKBP-type peptidyl-prolyl cis-trans isomerase 2
MSTVENGDTLTIVFIGKLDDGAVFVEITPDDPLTVIVGDSQLPPTVELAIIGMGQGESQKIRVPPEEGYGPRMKNLVHEVPLSNFGDRITPKPGMVLSQKVEKDGTEHKVPVTVMEVKEKSILIDYNHPLAGHHLTYELTIQEISKTN